MVIFCAKVCVMLKTETGSTSGPALGISSKVA